MSPLAFPRPLPVTASLVVLLAILAVLGLPRPASASGLGFGTTVVQQRALLSLVDGREEIVLSLDLAAPEGAAAGTAAARRPAVVLPVPATPTVTAVADDQTDLFGRLARSTAPRPVDQDGEADAAGAARAEAAIDVLSRQMIGDYEVTRLRATRGDALQRWLDGHGYAVPKRAVPVLRDYVARGWAFVAIRLAHAPRETSALRPLRIAFPSRRLVYPLRLAASAGRPLSVELYVAGPHRVIASGFDSYHAGTVAELRPPLPAPVRGLLRGPFLTKLAMVGKDPAAVRGDVTVRQAVSDRRFRASADYPFESEAGFATGPLPSEIEPTGPPPGTPSSGAWLLLFPAVAVMIGLLVLLLRLRERLRR